MSQSINRSYLWMFRWLLAAAIIATCANVSIAQSEAQVVKVEEDWEMVVGEPDDVHASPQVLCVFSPTADAESLHASLELNHHTVPEFEAGGMQFEVWEGKTALREKKFPIQHVLSTPGEVISWTQCMELQGSNLLFEIKDGTSSTWGAFGGQGYLKPYPVHAKMSNLNGYSPEVSVNSSGISHGANRVQSLVLKEVRLTLSTGEVLVDDTPRVIHSLEN